MPIRARIERSDPQSGVPTRSRFTGSAAPTLSAEFLVAGNASLVIDAGDGNDTVTGGHRNDLLIGGFGVDAAAQRHAGRLSVRFYRKRHPGDGFALRVARRHRPLPGVQDLCLLERKLRSPQRPPQPGERAADDIVAGPLAVNENAGNGTLVGTVNGRGPQAPR